MFFRGSKPGRVMTPIEVYGHQVWVYLFNLPSSGYEDYSGGGYENLCQMYQVDTMLELEYHVEFLINKMAILHDGLNFR